MMRILGCALVLALSAACAGPHAAENGEAAASIGICGDAGLKPGQPERIAEQLAMQNVELVGCLAADPVFGERFVAEWRRPTAFAGVRAGAPLPRPVDKTFGYSFDRGPLHVTVVETDDPMTVNSAAYLWLMDDLSLAGKPPAKPWKVVILSRPIFSLQAVRADRGRLDLAELLAREGVALVIATADAPAYFRRRRIGGSRQESTRYVVLGGEAALDPKKIPPWSARALGEPCCCVLDVNESVFRWAAYDLQGRLVDLLEFPAARAVDRAESFSLSEVLAGELPAE